MHGLLRSSSDRRRIGLVILRSDDFILLDLMRSDGDRFEVLRLSQGCLIGIWIRRFRAEARAIVLSGFNVCLPVLAGCK